MAIVGPHWWLLVAHTTGYWALVPTTGYCRWPSPEVTGGIHFWLMVAPSNGYLRPSMLATVGSHWCLLVALTGGPNWWPPLVVIGGLYYWLLDTAGGP